MSVHATPVADGMEMPTAEPAQELSKDEVFHILQTQRRRDALRYLKDHENPVEMRDMAEQVAAWENDTTVQALTSAERQRVYIALYQSHLPKLDREGIIDYNQSRGVVRREPLAAQFDPYLAEVDPEPEPEAEPAPEIESESQSGTIESDEPAVADDAAGSGLAFEGTNWLACYRAATVGGAFVLAASALGVPLVSALPDTILGALVIAAFAVISVLQTLDGQRSS